jgi:hypothetical protein
MVYFVICEFSFNELNYTTLEDVTCGNSNIFTINETILKIVFNAENNIMRKYWDVGMRMALFNLQSMKYYF